MCEKVVNLSVQELKSVEAAECENNLINSEKEQKMVKSEDKLISWRQADQEGLDGMTIPGSHAN